MTKSSSKKLQNPFLRAGATFLGVSLAIGLLATAATAIIREAADTPADAAVTMVPIANEHGEPLRDPAGNYLVLRVDQRDAHFFEVMSRVAEASERRGQSARAEQNFRAIVEETFGYDRALARQIVRDGFDNDENGRRVDQPNIVSVDVEPIVGQAWLRKPDRGILDPRNFVERVSEDEYIKIQDTVNKTLSNPTE